MPKIEMELKVGDTIYKEEFGTIRSYTVLKVTELQMKLKSSSGMEYTIRGPDILTFYKSVQEAYRAYRSKLEVNIQSLRKKIEENEIKIQGIDKILEKDL